MEFIFASGVYPKVIIKMSEADKHPPSDMDEDKYLELKKESTSTGKSIERIITDRREKEKEKKEQEESNE